MTITGLTIEEVELLQSLVGLEVAKRDYLLRTGDDTGDYIHGDVNQSHARLSALLHKITNNCAEYR